MISLSCSAGFEKLADHSPGKQETKQDSSIWVENPVPDQLLTLADTLAISVYDIFNWSIDTLNVYSLSRKVTSISEISPIRSANFNSNEDSLKIITSNNVYGHAYANITIVTNCGTASDEFLIRVEDPDYQWIAGGTSFSFVPENCIGSGNSQWKAAYVFELGNDFYELNSVEFGYAWDGMADWEIVNFDEVPTDSLIGSLYGTKSMIGGWSAFIDDDFISTLTGSIAVVFTTTSNFMSMDPAGNSDHTWIYSESAGWEHPEEYSPDYAGAWYIKLFVKKTGAGATGIEEIISSVRSPVLLKNYPNPFNSSTVISWDMPVSGKAELSVYNQKGQLVKCLNNCSLKKGVHSVVFEADGLDSGIYFYQLKINGKTESTAKMLYLR